MTAKYQVYKDKQGKFRFRLIAENGKNIVSGEAYEKHQTCLNGIESVKKNSMAATEDTTTEGTKISFPKYQIYEDKGGEFRFNLSASNGEIIASSEGYSTKDNCVKGIATVQRISNSEIEDLTIDQAPPETTDQTNPEPASQVEEQTEPTITVAEEQAEPPVIVTQEQTEPPLIVAQTTPIQGTDNNRNESPIVEIKTNSSRNIFAIAGLVIGIILLAVGFVCLSAVLGPIDITTGAVVLLAGEVVIGIALILFITKKR